MNRLENLFSSFMAPYPAPYDLKRLVAEISAKVGVSPVPQVLIDPQFTGTRNAYTNWRMRDGQREYGIFFPDDYQEQFPGSHLETVIAHELGHIANNDLENIKRAAHAREYRADAFAARHGFNVAGLLDLSPSTDESDTHPSKHQRIAHLRRIKK